MSEHTPGPWETYLPPNGQQWVTAGKKPNGITRCIATVWRPDGDDVSIVREANARLIAAAPDLLAACKEALHQLSPANPVPMDGLDRTRMWLRAAIARAEGVTS